ncbi:MAG: RrF2 family transcriptional regulator [Gemmatimonadota bacterium]
MIYSSACEYAIRAATHLALRSPGEFVRASDISDAEEIPAPFLSSVLQRLVAFGLLDSTRGPGGGYRLARAPENISLRDIKEAIDGLADLEACALGLGACSDDRTCPLHESWQPIRERIRAYLADTTLDRMANALESRRQREG